MTYHFTRMGIQELKRSRKKTLVFVKLVEQTKDWCSRLRLEYTALAEQSLDSCHRQQQRRWSISEPEEDVLLRQGIHIGKIRYYGPSGSPLEHPYRDLYIYKFASERVRDRARVQIRNFPDRRVSHI